MEADKQTNGISCDLKGMRVAISLPCYSGKIPVDWAVAFAQTQALVASHGAQSWLQCRMNSGLIHAVRNELVHTALADATTTHILFIDDDVVWDAASVVRMLAFTTLGPEFVCGMYPARMEEPQFFAELAKSDDGKLIQSEHGLLLARGVPAGFMLIKREVFENKRLIAQCPVTIPSRGDLKGEHLVGYFDYMHEGLTSMGEDIAFCRRWNRASGQIWIDPSIKLKHYGSKVYEHDFVQYLRDKQA